VLQIQKQIEGKAVAAETGDHVDLRIYPGMDHTIIRDELQKVRSMIQS